MTTARGVAVFLLLAFGVACSSAGGNTGGDDGEGAGGSGGGTGTGPGAKRTLLDFCTFDSQVEQDWCTYHAKCCTAEDRAATEFFAVDCNDPTKTTSATKCAADYQEIIDKGVYGFDGTYVDACIADLKPGRAQPPSTCNGLGIGDALTALRLSKVKSMSQSDACRHMLPGKAKENEKCDYASQCAFGLVCRGLSTGSDFTCAKPAPEFGPCAILDSECPLGQQCVDKACVTAQSSGGTCAFDSDCGPGLVCGFPSGKSRCVTAVDVGGNCKDDLQSCKTGLYCSINTNKCTSPSPAGALCDIGLCAGRCDKKTNRCVDICGGDQL